MNLYHPTPKHPRPVAERRVVTARVLATFQELLLLHELAHLEEGFDLSLAVVLRRSMGIPVPSQVESRGEGGKQRNKHVFKEGN